MPDEETVNDNEEPAVCGYRPQAGTDVDIDGTVWPGSAYDKHIDSCDICRPQFERAAIIEDETRVAEIRQRAEAATIGPWIPEHGVFGTMLTAGRTHLGPLTVASVPSRRDAEFIAAAREDIPRLVDCLRAAQERERWLEGTIADLRQEVQIAREGRQAAIELMNQHRCDDQAEKAFTRTIAAEARMAEAEAVIAEAPHAPECMNLTPAHYFPKPACTCWKSRYRAGADQ